MIRIAQGGHFLSDVLFAAIFMALTASALHVLLIGLLAKARTGRGARALSPSRRGKRWSRACVPVQGALAPYVRAAQDAWTPYARRLQDAWANAAWPRFADLISALEPGAIVTARRRDYRAAGLSVIPQR